MLIDKSVTEPEFISTASAGVYPTGTAGTGTLVSVGTNVVGTGTSFTDYKVGQYIYTTDQVRRITAIKSATVLQVNRAFAAPLSSAAFQVVTELPQFNIGIFNGSAGNVSIGTCTYDAQVLPTVTGMNFKSNNSIGPICWTAGSNVLITNGEFVK